MPNFDEVLVINITHANFDQRHNSQVFQTKDLACEMSEYCIFNGVLYQQVDRSGDITRHDKAIRQEYSGELNIYTCKREKDVAYWVEYDLRFESGELVDVVGHEINICEDNRDLAVQRPDKPTNLVEVTISVAKCDRAKQDAFVGTLTEEKMTAIRAILAEPTATICYPVKPDSVPRPGVSVPRLFTIASYGVDQHHCGTSAE